MARWNCSKRSTFSSGIATWTEIPVAGPLLPGSPSPGARRLLEALRGQRMVASRERDQALHAYETGDQRVGEIARPQRLERRRAELVLRLVEAIQRDQRFGSREPRQRPAHGGIALERRAKQLRGALMVAGGVAGHPPPRPPPTPARRAPRRELPARDLPRHRGARVPGDRLPATRSGSRAHP